MGPSHRRRLRVSLKAMTWVWDHAQVGGSDLLLLLAIADNADDTGANAWPSIATLARKCRVDERTVQRIIRRLVAAQHLVVETTTGGRRSNRYALAMPAPDASSTGSPTPPANRHPAETPPPARRQGRGGTSATAGVAQPRHPNVLEPSSNDRHAPTRPRRAYADQQPAARSGAALPPPSTTPRCLTHTGQLAHNCPACRAETLGGTS
ncbi:hypothetical protein GCM10017581_097860 [Dactylosporangium matsuzakiense]|uniref:Helix-turn-helix protein n=1 Tax=Dactylosporangium matsuzakiense TaxID=53360 RepID=A0A9W6KTW8_9ACTN|nr:hypothetical protein GCM10017581_097860 [Dactylosporangium matsuzakiense]